VTNANKREYVLLKAQKMLWGTVEAQMSAIIDAFHLLVPRELVEKYAFTPLELQMLVCGEQHIDVGDLRMHCKYEDGYTGKEPQIAWFWQAVESLDEAQRRALLQFWSGSDGMPAEGFASLEPAFHLVSVDRMYDRNDRTARLPAAHTCFRQLDLPRYNSYEELREKMLTAITMGQVSVVVVRGDWCEAATHSLLAVRPRACLQSIVSPQVLLLLLSCCACHLFCLQGYMALS
jgi:E3 ubiquitin-protein ligase HUWE1